VTPQTAQAIVDHTARFVNLEASHNFRDLGGYPIHDGRKTKWGEVFRADALFNLTAIDLATITELGITTVIDLRSADELETRGRFPSDRHDAVVHHYPVIDVPWSDDDVPDFQDPVDFLLWAYPEMFDKGGHQLAAAVNTIANSPGPAVFHCAAGKDRTGLVALLILGSLGVDDEVIIADFAHSDVGLERLRIWAEANESNLSARLGAAPAAFMKADGRAMRIVIDQVVAEHGSIREFAQKLGVTERSLSLLEERLLVGAP
jgi:protein-tyrosine phosphatase